MCANEKIKIALKKCGKIQKDLADALNISKRTLDTKFYKGGFYADELIQIADYLNVSIDYLITGHDPLPKDLTADEAEWLELYRKLDPSEQLEHRAELKGYIKAKERMWFLS